MASEYDHKNIEKKWQDKWAATNAFRATDDSSKPKTYVLDMFPYPSGFGIHMGHVEAYTATDIYARYKRTKGFEVLHPIGWDSFGLPAENYAIKTGVHPQQTTDAAINNFRRQIKELGLSYDWAREVGAHTPEYYKWTQWFFLFLYKNGLAEKKMAKVNWCPKDQTVLANEQTVSESGEKGVCVRCGTKVIQKDLEQWFFKITDFADALVDELDGLDWPESTKTNQRNWIGRSEGAEIKFDISDSDKKITVFTTRPDTLFGATYMVLAPEHPLVKELADELENKAEVIKYTEAAKNKTDVERQEEAKDKTGVELKGIKAINPANKEEIPVFIADYVLWGYGTGAIMAVPAHDERDFEFAKKFNVPVRRVIEPVLVQTTGTAAFRESESVQDSRGIIAIVKHWSEDKYLGLRWPTAGWGTFLTGGIDEGFTPEQTVLKEIHEETGYKNAKIKKYFGIIHSKYYHELKKLNRFGHAPTFLVELADDARDEVSDEETAKHELKWLTKDELKTFLTATSHLQALEYLTSTVYTGPGILADSGEFSGMDSVEAKKKITEFVGGKMVKTYRLRDWLISRQRYWGAPIPVVYDPKGKAHPIPEEHLPWVLPTDVEFKPTGTSPLGQSKELLARTEKIFGKGWRPEIDTMDTFVCSSWYFYRFADPHNEQEFAGKKAIKNWLPVDVYMGGAEHTVLHLLYARFFTKALQKFSQVDFTEPFLKLRHQGTILAEDGSKMSKSKGNVTNPDEPINLHGADAVRLYIMFMGPLEASKPWITKGMSGVVRFIERVWRVQDLVQDAVVPALDTILEQTVKKVGDDIEAFKFNTAVSQMMILLNAIEKEKKIGKAQWQKFLSILAPFAPHIAHELAERHDVDISLWPMYDAKKIIGLMANVAVQVNGKRRAIIELSREAPEDIALKKARTAVGKWLEGKTEKKTVYVPGKIISFLTS